MLDVSFFAALSLEMFEDELIDLLKEELLAELSEDVFFTETLFRLLMGVLEEALLMTLLT